MNYTGAGVVVAVVDEGLSPTHPELSKNYVSLKAIMIMYKGNKKNKVSPVSIVSLTEKKV